MKLTEEQYEALMRQRWRCVGNQATVPAADVEPHISHESVGKEKTQGLVTPCSIHVHSRTNRLADAEGRSAKAVIDALTAKHTGILVDDSPKYVSEVSQSQEKTTGDEETIITLRW